MDKLPSEILVYILSFLNSSDRLRACFTCRRWLSLMLNTLPPTVRVGISLDTLTCNFYLSHTLDSETSICMCICPEHIREHSVMLGYLFNVVAPAINSMIIDDDLVRHDNKVVSDNVIHSILLETPASIEEFIFSGVDLSHVRDWTFGLLAKFKSLKDFSLLDCAISTSESILLRVLSPSYNTLVSISITYSQRITDKFSSVIARRCPLVDRVDYTGCAHITSLSLVAFCEADSYRTAEMLFIGLSGTGFNYSKLCSYLVSPLMIGGMFWKVSMMKLQVGYPRNTVCLENTRQRNHLILGFL
uniref:F-box domain-containing protein n=1 Tax=Syphacia muris TaxID=451379 RepID=A0A0N5A8Z7_9BILA